MDRSPGFGSASADFRPVKTRFPFGSVPEGLNLASSGNSPDRSTKSTRLYPFDTSTACKHRVSGSLSLPSRGPFHLSFTVLCAIGHQVVFSLTGWSPLLPTRFHVSRGTLDPAVLAQFSLTGLSPSLAGLSRTVLLTSLVTFAVRTPECSHSGLGSFPFARRYSGNHYCFLFLRLLRCFSSPGSLCTPIQLALIQCTVTEGSSAGFPHSDICGSMDICSSPQLFAAYHVFLRLLVPRHPPCALFSLTLLRIHSVVCFFLRTSESFLTHCFVSDVFSFILIFYPVSFSKNLLDFRYLRFSFSIRFSRYIPD